MLARFVGVLETACVDFSCYHRDRRGSGDLRMQMLEEHWAYMDRYAAAMIARGPTFTTDGTLTGSVHILTLDGPDASRAFALDEPGYQAGIYRDVLIRRWHNTLGRTMWDVGVDQGDRECYLVLGFTPPLEVDPASPAPGGSVIVQGPLLSDDGSAVLGAALLVETSDPRLARDLLDAATYADVEVHRWRPGGRPRGGRPHGTP